MKSTASQSKVDIQIIMKNIDYKMQERVDIEKRLTCLEVTVRELCENHIPHLQAKVDKIQWLLITNLVAVIFLLADQLLK